MTPIMKFQTWFSEGPKVGRACGDCYACCVYLGINELRKYAGQTCKHLDGNDPCKRCSIYAARPTACHTYKCLWLEGVGPDDMRPQDCGMLMTGHGREEDGRPREVGVTLTVFDHKKAAGRVIDVAIQLLMNPIITEVRAIDLQSKRALLFRDGHFYKCQILGVSTEDKGMGNYEGLRFAAGPSVGRYLLTTEGELRRDGF